MKRPEQRKNAFRMKRYKPPEPPEPRPNKTYYFAVVLRSFVYYLVVIRCSDPEIKNGMQHAIIFVIFRLSSRK